MEAYTTHEIFFRKITRNKMNEFLNRVSTKYLENQINQELQGYRAITELSALCNNVYIKFKDKNQNKIGHISFHLNKENKTMRNNSRRKGRLHIVNNRNKQKYHTLRVNYINDLMSIRVNSQLKMNTELDYCVNNTMPIINSYLDINSDYSLKYKLTSMKGKENECLHTIESISTHKSFRTTPRQNPSIISIPKQDLYSWKK
jgi:hypothetical protein